MSLSSALESAKSSLSATSAQTAIVSRNIANVNNPGVSRKYVNVTTGPLGGVQVGSVARSTNAALFNNLLDANSSLGNWQAVSDGLTQLDQTIGSVDDETSPAALIGKLQDALSAYSVDPSKSELASTALQAASTLAQSLNDATAIVQGVRNDADSQIAGAVSDLNNLLGQLKDLNDKVVKGTRSGADVTDLVDQRDQVVSSISQYIGVSTKTRGDNDLVLYTDSGVTLFETNPRDVTFTQTLGLDATKSGAAVRIDGVAVTGDTATMPLKSGKIVGLVSLRDDVAVTYQNQLDQIAQGLVQAFGESDQTGGTNPDRPGLFTTAAAEGDSSLDLGSIRTAGLAGTIKIADAALGSPSKIRDGGINGPDYVYNAVPAGATSAPAGNAARINQVLANLGSARSFEASARIDTKGTIADFATSSVSWLEALRSNALSQSDAKSTLLDRTQTALSDKTGINLDDEMTHLLELEHSYQASAKLVSAIDDMLKTLLDNA